MTRGVLAALVLSSAFVGAALVSESARSARPDILVSARPVNDRIRRPPKTAVDSTFSWAPIAEEADRRLTALATKLSSGGSELRLLVGGTGAYTVVDNENGRIVRCSTITNGEDIAQLCLRVEKALQLLPVGMQANLPFSAFAIADLRWAQRSPFDGRDVLFIRYDEPSNAIYASPFAQGDFTIPMLLFEIGRAAWSKVKLGGHDPFPTINSVPYGVGGPSVADWTWWDARRRPEGFGLKVGTIGIDADIAATFCFAASHGLRSSDELLSRKLQWLDEAFGSWAWGFSR